MVGSTAAAFAPGPLNARDPAGADRRRPARPPAPERTLDQVILKYLTSEADQEQLVLKMEDARDLAFGPHALLALRATSSKSVQPVVGTQISVRMISTVAEPRVLGAGRTDDGGCSPMASRSRSSAAAPPPSSSTR